jgi:hypothetical protein
MKNISSNRVSSRLGKYLYCLKKDERYEVYETLVLMILNDNLLVALERLIEDNFKSVKRVGNKLNMTITSSKKYEEAVDSVCRSKYFKESFSKEEIERRKIIALKVIIEIATKSGLDSILKDVQTSINFCEVRFPSIEHKILSENGIKKINLTFIEGTPINDITKYLKETLDVKNRPKKKKISLGQGLRLLEVNNEVRFDTDKYKKLKGEYIEQVISTEMNRRFGEKLTMEKVSKLLQRIKSTKRDMNIIMDK